MPSNDEVKRVSQKIEKVVSRFHLTPPRLMRQHQLAHHTSKQFFCFFRAKPPLLHYCCVATQVHESSVRNFMKVVQRCLLEPLIQFHAVNSKHELCLVIAHAFFLSGRTEYMSERCHTYVCTYVRIVRTTFFPGGMLGISSSVYLLSQRLHALTATNTAPSTGSSVRSIFVEIRASIF